MPPTPSPSPSPPQFASPNGPRVPLVDAATLARELGTSRDWVYEHSDLLGALRLGSGPRPRLRFDPVAARAALTCYGGGRSQAQNPRADGEFAPAPAPRARPMAARRPKPGSILPS